MPEPDRNLSARLPGCLWPPPARGARAFYWLLIIAIAVLGFYLISAEKPWNPKLQRSIEKRVADGKSWKIEHCITVFSWIAAAINFLLAAGLLATLRLWSQPIRLPAAPRLEYSKPLLVGLAIAVVIGGYFRVQRLDHSLWSDEEYTVRTHIWGQMIEAEDGTLEHQAVPWRDTFFRNKLNNHYGYTIPTRVLHDAWAGVAATPEHPFSEPVLRVLPLFASLASIALMGLIVARRLGVASGIAAAMLLALNPWHLRYSVEARGYSQALFFLLLAFVFLIAALRDGRWRNWLLFGAAEFLVLWSLIGAVYVLVITNAIAIAMIFLQNYPLRVRAASAGRMIVANLLAAMVFIQLVLPAVPQVRDYLATGPLVGHMHTSWWNEVWTLCTSGLPNSDPGSGQHLGSSFATESTHLHGFKIFFLIVLPSLAFIGLVGGIARRSWLLLPVAATIGGGILAFVQNKISGNYMHPWYVVYVLLGLVPLVVMGIHTCTFRIPWGKARQLPVVIALGILLVVYTIDTARARFLLCEYARQPIRQAAQSVRGTAGYTGHGDNLITASFGTSKGMITSYDPRARILKKPSDLKALIAEADTSGKSLAVYECGLLRALQEDSKFLKIVRDPALFKEQEVLVRGLEELFTYHIYHYVGGGEN